MTMRLSLIAVVLVLLPGLLLAASNRHMDAIEDNDFAEFEESDDDGQLIFARCLGGGFGFWIFSRQGPQTAVVCEQLAQGCYLRVQWLGIELTTSRSLGLTR